MNQGARIIVPLLGMHRSGTSLAARAFCEAGLPMGPALLRESQPDNAEGFWEDAEIVATQDVLMDSLLRDVGVGSQYAHDAAADFAPDWLDSPAAVTALNQLSGILDRRLADAPVFGFKDPRTPRLMPLWRRAAEALGARLAPVMLVRGPVPVAASLNARQCIHSAVGETLWLRSIADCLDATVNAQTPRIHYEDWSIPAAQLSRIGNFLASLGIAPTRAPAPFRMDLRHHAPTGSASPDIDAIHAGLVWDDSAATIRAAIAAFVDAHGGWRNLPAHLARATASAGQPGGLALGFPATPEDRSPPDPDCLLFVPEARAALTGSNAWSYNGWGGFRLHANDGPPSATLCWRGLDAPAHGRLAFTVTPSPDPVTPIELHVVLGGVSHIIPLPALDAPIDITLPYAAPSSVGLDIAITLRLADCGAAHSAWALIVRPRLLPP